MPQRLHNVLKPCQRAVGSPRNTPKTIKFVNYSVYTTSSQRPYSVHTTFPQRLYSVNVFFHSAHTVAAACSQRSHGAPTVRTHRSHGAHTTSSALTKIYLITCVLNKTFLSYLPANDTFLIDTRLRMIENIYIIFFKKQLFSYKHL